VIQRDPEPGETAPETIVPGGEEHILIVDDESMLVDVAKSRLNTLGYRVTIETDSVQALERFKQNPSGYDLVITDMTMPVMSGDKMAGSMLDIRPDIPIILCTGFHADMSDEKAAEMGFKSYLMKPTSFNELAMAVRRVLDGRI
jgi:CheY-like chemotaxis protein